MFDKAKLNQERGELIHAMRASLDLASADKRELTGEETAAYDAREARVDEIEANLARHAKLEGRKVEIAGKADVKTDTVERATSPLETEEYREAFSNYLRGKDVEIRALSVGTASLGGYTVPVAFRAQIIETLRQFGYVRSLATAIDTTEGNTLNIPAGTAYGASSWGSEAAPFGGTDATFGQVSLSAFKANHLAQVSEELLQDSGFDIEAYLAKHLGENLALLQNTAFVAGSGAGQPTGIFTNGVVGVTAGNGTVQVSSILPDTIFDIVHSLAPQYRKGASFIMHDNSIKIIRKLKDTQNRYLWEMSMQAGAPNTLLGYPVYPDPDVPQMGVSAKSIAFGDLSCYFVRSAGGISVQRLNELYAATGQVGFRVYERLDGKIADVAGIKLFQNAAS